MVELKKQKYRRLVDRRELTHRVQVYKRESIDKPDVNFVYFKKVGELYTHHKFGGRLIYNFGINNDLPYYWASCGKVKELEGTPDEYNKKASLDDKILGR